MLITVSSILAIALVLTWFKLRGHHRALADLRQSLARKQPFLRDASPGASGAEWDELCRTTNELLVELNRLQHQQLGQLSHLQATLGSLNEAVLIVDDKNHITLANQALAAIFPKAVETIDQRLEVVLHSVAFLNYVESVRAGQAEPQFPVEFVDGDDTRWVEVTGSTIPPLDGSKGQWALFVIHDITRLKKLELVRKDFVANVSHEIRTPLSVIKGYIETLVDGGEEIAPTDRRKFLDTIQRHTERLNSLLDDLLTLSRLESVNPGLHPETINLAHLMDGVVADYQSRPGAEDHQIISEIDPAIRSIRLDPLKITQVFANLIDNSLKYTPPGSNVILRAKQFGKFIEIILQDDGPGIPTEDLPHIFERFYRVEKGRSREKGGTGLGLSIVKHIINLHGGTIKVESGAGQGTSFFIKLPTSPHH